MLPRYLSITIISLWRAKTYNKDGVGARKYRRNRLRKRQTGKDTDWETDRLEKIHKKGKETDWVRDVGGKRQVKKETE